MSEPATIVYGELSILGYNGSIPQVEKSGRRNKSKFLLCQRPAPNGIKKSRHYIVKQPQATKAIQDKDLHSISYTFSRSQTIIVEYQQDEHTDMFQIGRSSEDPIDFVLDTVAVNTEPNSYLNYLNNNSVHHIQYPHQHHHHNHNHGHRMQNYPSQHPRHELQDNSSNNQHNHPWASAPSRYIEHNENQVVGSSSSGATRQHHSTGLTDMTQGRAHRHLSKVGEEMAANMNGPPATSGHHHRSRAVASHPNHAQAVPFNYSSNVISNLPPAMMDLLRDHDPLIFQGAPPPHYLATQQSFNQSQPLAPHHAIMHLLYPSGHPNLPDNPNIQTHEHQQQLQMVSTAPAVAEANHSGRHVISKRSHATQSTISRFACRILVERHPPYRARIYAAGFDSSKNIFLGEKATKWEQGNSIDGLTTNGVLLMNPQGEAFSKDVPKAITTASGPSPPKVPSEGDLNAEPDLTRSTNTTGDGDSNCNRNELTKDINSDLNHNSNQSHSEQAGDCIRGDPMDTCHDADGVSVPDSKNDKHLAPNENTTAHTSAVSATPATNDKSTREADDRIRETRPAVWREVSVDGGIYAVRESRSAAQKGQRIEDETNVLQDGALIDLCGATLLWRSLEGFRAAPSRRSLEEKVDGLNALRPQCPVGLNTLVIPRKPIFPSQRAGHKAYHHSRDPAKSNHQPYVYFKCGHVQGYHDWGQTDKYNQRTCPICLSCGTVSKLSMGLEPSFYVDSGPLTHAFNPCGHMASERTVRYWSSIKIPHGTHFFHSICPFCATPLATVEQPFIKLIFQDELD